ncbi:hypothetical protein [Kushneria aurantia]|uniref:DUF4393 domain-containing protein n=1 Tax=Kushneria aurantia TaxID=504092 RepID=A0ABV6G4H3_9GAMM|nr:hypothetical protein [Kushneria aurantia]
MSTERDNDGLDENLDDQLIAWGKAAAGLIPVVGGFVGEMIGIVIPAQRSDRIVAYLRGLKERLDHMDEEFQRSIRNNAEKIDLIEEGGYQAARATTAERINLIVEAVARGLTAEESEVVRRKRLLVLFGQLDEDEAAILNAYGQSYGRGRDPEDPFAGINRPRPPRIGGSQEDVDANSLYEIGIAHLTRLGLLKKNFGSLKKGQTPTFDPQKGDFEHRVEVSTLGRLLLKEIGRPTPFDQQTD